MKAFFRCKDPVAALEEYADELLKESENRGTIELSLGSTLIGEEQSDEQSFSGSASFFLTLKQDLDYYAKEMVKVDYYGGTPMERMQNITFFRKRVKTLDNPKAL